MYLPLNQRVCSKVSGGNLVLIRPANRPWPSAQLSLAASAAALLFSRATPGRRTTSLRPIRTKFVLIYDR